MDQVNFNHFPIVICQNDQNIEQDGRHWILYWNEKKCEKEEPAIYFFCSFGNSLSSYKVQKPPCFLIKENKLAVQTDSSRFCGYFVICLAANLMNGRSFCSILEDFKPNKFYNDRLVFNFFNSLRFCEKGSRNGERIQICIEIILGCK